MIANGALEIFRERGYHATSVRDLAQAAEMTVAALYYHFANKQDILVFVMRRTMADVMSDVNAARAAAADDPRSQLVAMVRAHVGFHTRRQTEAFVAHAELRSLEPEHREEIIELRDRYEHMLAEIVRQGVEQGAFRPAHEDEAVRAILAMCTAVATWYREGGPLSLDDVADRYSDLTLAILRATDAPPR